MKEKARNGILILFGVGVLVYLFATAMIALTDRQNVHTVTIHEACGVLELEHSINGLIPIGTDYYYLGVDDETGYGYLIKGSKKWLEKNFDENYQSLQPGGVQIKGLVKTITEYKLERELTDRLSQLDGLQYPYGLLGCMDLNYVRTAVLKLADVFLLLFAFLGFRYVVKRKDSTPPWFIKVWLVTLIVSMMLLIVIIR